MSRAALLVLVILALAGCADLRGPGADARVEVASWSLVGGHLVGEIVDRGPDNARALRVAADFYDAHGARLASGLAPAWRQVLQENETSPFDLPAPEGAVNATVRALGEATRAPAFERQHLEPRDVRTTQAVGSDTVAFQGTAYNAGDITIVGVEAQVTFRDEAGRVVGVARATPDAPALRAGEGSLFHGNATLAAPFLRYDVVVVTTGAAS